MSDRETAAFLERLRKNLGLTQAQVAERCGLRQSDVSRIETGKRSLSFVEATQFAAILNVPLQALLTGEMQAGTRLGDLALELRHLGIADLMVADERVPGAFRPAEEVAALAVGVERPEPRVIEALPAVLAWNRWRAELLAAFACVTHPLAITRLAWLAEITLTIDRTEGFPGGLISGDDLIRFLDSVDRPDEPDDLGHPGEGEPPHRVWKYWRIGYAADLTTFRNRAADLEARRPCATRSSAF